MKLNRLITWFIVSLMVLATIPAQASLSRVLNCDVLVVGGGTGGTAAGIQSARLGAKTIIVESTSWLGGMLTAAGVSATDGDNSLASGIWQEFRQAIWKRYGGPEAVSTGWVSNTCFQPYVADSIFKSMAAKEKDLKVIYNFWFLHVLKAGNRVVGAVFTDNRDSILTVHARIVIDATELGDVFRNAGAGYNVGLRLKAQKGKPRTRGQDRYIIQDITYVATLKDYGPAADKTISRPASYDSTMFICSCKNKGCPNAQWSPRQMLYYGKLPDNEYMINWPGNGNDFYLNAIDMTHVQRERAYRAAKEKTLCFVYFIQHELGYKNLGLADDEYPTKDKLPFIPYNREGRRVKGVVRLTVDDLLHPYSSEMPLYRTDISVGDYPIDMHIKENPSAPQVTLPKIPSFGVPLGCLIPRGIDGLIVADKGISVSEFVNGATRTTTCVLLTGQAAGTLAAYCVEHHVEPAQANVRSIQDTLLDCNAYLLPFVDVNPSDPMFKAAQRIGATGILKGYGVPYDWANQTWFYPDRPISQYELVKGLRSYYPGLDSYNEATGQNLTVDSFLKIISIAGKNLSLSQVNQDWKQFQFGNPFAANLQLNRGMTAVLLDHYLHPFNVPVDLSGHKIAHRKAESR